VSWFKVAYQRCYKYIVWLKWGGLCPQIDIYGRKFNFQHCYELKKIQFWKPNQKENKIRKV